MSGWISSKLKVAETLLQQIDQQAAESLRKNEASRSDDDLGPAIPKKPNETLPPLKDQLSKKKKTSPSPEKSEFVGKLRNDGNPKIEGNKIGGSLNKNPKSSLTDSDWTELLSAPSNTINGSNGGVPRVPGLWKEGKRQGRSGSNLLALERKRSQAVQNKSARKSDVVLGGKGNGDGVDGRQRSDGVDGRQRSDGSDSTPSSVELQGVTENLDTSELVSEDASENAVMDSGNEANDERNKVLPAPESKVPDGVPHLKEDNSRGVQSAANHISDLNVEVQNEHTRLKGSMLRDNKINDVPETSSRPTGSMSASDSESNSETDSDSTSDSESEREREERRKRREQILAEKAAAKAIEAIKDRENLVAKLEGEKESLEKIIDERAKQQAREASELQTTMMETMDAVDLEKQKHNNTRMEALMKLAKLETTNAELAKSLATAQWNLEVEVKRVAELHRQIELKEARHEELMSKKKSHQSGNKLTASKGVEFEHEILEAEHAFVTDKVGQLQEKAKTLETSIEVTRKEMDNPTEVEVELNRRLGQLTDHLIQKQAQVEALSSEKATLMFRIEAVSRWLEENKSSLKVARNDVESGIWELSNSRLQKGQKHIGSLVRQLDSIFSTGAAFLRRNPTARTWAVAYLACLHLWVVYILKSHGPSVSEEATTGAVISLENINTTGI